MLIKHPHFEQGSPNEPAGGQQAPEKEVETKELETLNSKDQTALTEQEKARLTELQGKYEQVYKDAKGNVLTKEQVAAAKELETKVNTILNKPEDQWTPEEKKFIEENTEPTEENKKSVYQQIDEQRGLDLGIDYGDVDPLSVEGVALREEVLEKRAVKEYDNTLKAKYPRAYQFMVHVAQGGKEEDFFKPENADFKSLTINKEDKAGQEKILRMALAAKGNSSAIIEAVITSVKDKVALYETAKEELEKLQAEQNQKEQANLARANAMKQKEEQDYANLADSIETAVSKGFEGIVVPEKDRRSFLDFLGSRLDYNNGRFYVAKELNPKEITKELKYQYFEFKGGDLKGLVEREAKAQVARKIKSAIKAEIVPKNGGTGGSSNYKPLKEIF